MVGIERKMVGIERKEVGIERKMVGIESKEFGNESKNDLTPYPSSEREGTSPPPSPQERGGDVKNGIGKDDRDWKEGELS